MFQDLNFILGIVGLLAVWGLLAFLLVIIATESIRDYFLLASMGWSLIVGIVLSSGRDIHWGFLVFIGLLVAGLEAFLVKHIDNKIHERDKLWRGGKTLEAERIDVEKESLVAFLYMMLHIGMLALSPAILLDFGGYVRFVSRYVVYWSGVLTLALWMLSLPICAVIMLLDRPNSEKQ